MPLPISPAARRASFQRLDDQFGAEERYERESVRVLDTHQTRAYEVWRAGRVRRVLRAEVSALLKAGVAFTHAFASSAPLGLEVDRVAAGGRPWVRVAGVADACEVAGHLVVGDELARPPAPEKEEPRPAAATPSA